MRKELIEIPVTEVVNDNFVIHKNDVSGKIVLSEAEAALLLIELWKFLSLKKDVNEMLKS